MPVLEREDHQGSNNCEGESQRKVAGNGTSGTVYHVHVHPKNTLEILITKKLVVRGAK